MADVLVAEGSVINGVQRTTRYKDMGDGTHARVVAAARPTDVTVDVELNEVAFGAGGNDLVGDPAFTFITDTLAVPILKVGTTPFTFSETAGVLQLGDTDLTFDPATNTLLLGSGGKVIADYANFTAIYTQTDAAFVTSIDMSDPTRVSINANDGADNTISVALQLTGVANIGRFVPNSATVDLGATSAKWRSGYFGMSVVNAGYFEQAEMTAPAAPAANSVRIYAEDNGAGKTRLMALFASGAAQQIAIQP